ncbi:LOW QUALITY PROTEIN: hypothetical protein MC885_002592 [Smutsia gigantea]|nr:LOW QUALITY PROTEIN: hypothetical protein MC885_002592 [Smutsia gigantea]
MPGLGAKPAEPGRGTTPHPTRTHTPSPSTWSPTYRLVPPPPLIHNLSSYPTCPALEGVPGVMAVLVLAGYRAREEDELSLAPGDVVWQVCEGPSGGWLRGELGGRCGLFPERLVQEIPETLLRAGETSRSRCTSRRAPGPGGRLAESRNGSSPARFGGCGSGRLARRPAVCDWFSSAMPRPGAGSGGAEGALAASPSPAKRTRGFRYLTRPNPGCPAKSWGPQRWCKVNFSYIPEQTDELSLQVGEIVEVIKEIEDGWWQEKNRQLGAFLSNFVELLDSGPPSETWTMWTP